MLQSVQRQGAAGAQIGCDALTGAFAQVVVPRMDVGGRSLATMEPFEPRPAQGWARPALLLVPLLGTP